MRMTLVALGLLLLSAPLSVNAEAAKPDDAKGAKAPAAKSKTYCIEYEPFTGSRVRSKECNTREGWARQGVDVDKLGKD